MRKILSTLVERRVPQALVAYAGAGWLVLQGVDQLIGQDLLPPMVYRVVLTFVVAGVPATVIIAWFHGAKGNQRVTRTEVWTLGGLALAAFAVGGVALERSHRGDDAGPRYDPNRLAVLYFDVLNPDSSLTPLAAGLTESLIGELRQVKALDVISKNGVARFRGSDTPVDSIASTLEVGTLLQGSVARSGDRLRVHAALIDAETGHTLEAKTLESLRADVFALQDSLALEVSSWLRERLGEEIKVRAVRQGTESVGAWELVQRAEDVVGRVEPLIAGGDLRAGTREYAAADSLLGAAERLDPRWPVPPVRRAALAYQRSRWTGTSDRERAAALVRDGLEHADRALSIDRSHAEALEVKGTLLYWSYLLNVSSGPGTRLLREAEEHLRRAVEADPLQAGAWSVLSHLLANRQGAEEEAKVAAVRAYQADAYLANADVILWRLFLSSYDLEDSVEAERWCERGRARFAEAWQFHDCRLWLMTMEEVEPRPDSAWALYRDLERHIPPPLESVVGRRGRMAVAAVLARAGLADSALRVADDARAEADVDPTRDLAYMEAFVQALLGRKEEAIRLLASYLAANPQKGPDAADNWWFRALREEPAFQTLVSG